MLTGTQGEREKEERRASAATLNIHIKLERNSTTFLDVRMDIVNAMGGADEMENIGHQHALQNGLLMLLATWMQLGRRRLNFITLAAPVDCLRSSRDRDSSALHPFLTRDDDDPIRKRGLEIFQTR